MSEGWHSPGPRPATVADPFDHTLRYFVPSRSDPKAPPYLVELDAFNGNGACVCKDFQVRREPLLRRGVTPESAVELKLIKLKVNRHVEDALRCEHILTARSQFADDVIKAISDDQKKRTPQAHRVA